MASGGPPAGCTALMLYLLQHQQVMRVCYKSRHRTGLGIGHVFTLTQFTADYPGIPRRYFHQQVYLQLHDKFDIVVTAC